MSDEEKVLETIYVVFVGEPPHQHIRKWSTGPFEGAAAYRLAALQGASAGEGDAPKGVDGCEHEWVNEACDGNHYNCQRCPATFIYDRNADEPIAATGGDVEPGAPCGCPWCGNLPRVCPDTSYGDATVFCSDDNDCPVHPLAGADLWSGETVSDAIRRWNTRATLSPSDRDMRELLHEAIEAYAVEVGEGGPNGFVARGRKLLGKREG